MRVRGYAASRNSEHFAFAEPRDLRPGFQAVLSDASLYDWLRVAADIRVVLFAASHTSALFEPRSAREAHQPELRTRFTRASARS